MKIGLLCGSLLCCAPAFANDQYSFVKNFNLETVTIQGSVATITVSHPQSFGEPRFELIPGQACAMSYPAQCSGTLVRLDNSGYNDNIVKTTFYVDLAKLYYKEGVVVTIHGPKSKNVTVQY